MALEFVCPIAQPGPGTGPRNPTLKRDPKTGP